MTTFRHAPQAPPDRLCTPVSIVFLLYSSIAFYTGTAIMDVVEPSAEGK